jgi:menaquinone-specific isochorismate synthase
VSVLRAAVSDPTGPDPAGPVGPALTSRTRPLAEPPDLLAALSAHPDGFAWLHDGAGLVAWGEAARVPIRRGAGRLHETAATVAALLAGIESDDTVRVPGSGPLAVGALGFADDGEAELIVPAVVVGATRTGQAWITETGPPGPTPPDPEALSVPSRFVVDGHGLRVRWGEMVEEVLARIASGALSKVVLAREVTIEADRPFDLATIVTRLRGGHPTCFTFAAGGLVGATPELLVRRRDALVVSRPMAGTAPRGDTLDDDRRLLAKMRSSNKEGREHRVVVDAVRAALGPVCEEVSASAQPEVARLATVAHLATTVAGRLKAPWPSALALAGLLHPTPAVAGSPRPAALAAIAELERFDRGGYAGPVGWVDSRGDGDWAVALRCARIDGSVAHLFAGAGIVAGSSAAAEWAETQAKLEPMMRALVQP